MNKSELSDRIKKNEENLALLLKKRENLTLQIENLENKIRNQKFQLEHQKN
jgi:hypothetical protein